MRHSPAIDTPVETRSTIGQNVPRVEDRRLLQGQGEFVDDVWMHRTGHAHFVRSPYGHARIVSIDVSRAMSLDGVYTVLTGEEARRCAPSVLPDSAGARGRPRGVATGRRQGALPRRCGRGGAGRDTRAGARRGRAGRRRVRAAARRGRHGQGGRPRRSDPPRGVGSNVAWHGEYDWGDIDWALENADHVVEIDRLHFHRFSSTPLECNGAVVNWDPGTGRRGVQLEQPDADVRRRW